jgi:RNase P subunit RPR2
VSPYIDRTTGRRDQADASRRKGNPVGRRGIKEYRAAEALVLIAADRDHKPLVCPSCSTPSVDRNPKRNDLPSGHVTLTCKTCGRVASYLERGSVTSPEEPRQRG